ncbi:hypothetical protein DFH08DRAFT_807999 [Mycena albidolilacea]|uniref:Uncharacterized protein n=1 Tax=Mycena albidolilacea TaxID=1033008 RepID=A0AAD7ERN7_9AGAR|nr:hypothetical protein DFH08DRAFT_807999 [Mycena albidolilacea]
MPVTSACPSGSRSAVLMCRPLGAILRHQICSVWWAAKRPTVLLLRLKLRVVCPLRKKVHLPSKPSSPPPSSAAALSPSGTRHSRRAPRLRPLPARKASLGHLERWGEKIKPKPTVAAVADAPSRTWTLLSLKPRNANPTKTGGIRLALSRTGLERILIPPRCSRQRAPAQVLTASDPHRPSRSFSDALDADGDANPKAPLLKAHSKNVKQNASAASVSQTATHPSVFWLRFSPPQRQAATTVQPCPNCLVSDCPFRHKGTKGTNDPAQVRALPHVVLRRIRRLAHSKAQRVPVDPSPVEKVHYKKADKTDASPWPHSKGRKLQTTHTPATFKPKEPPPKIAHSWSSARCLPRYPAFT